MPHALITGASGFVGSHLVDRLMRDGWKVRILVRDASKLLAPTAGMLEIVTGNLADLEVLATAVRDVDIVFHCAANVATWASEAEYFEANVCGADNLLTAIIQNNRSISRVVHLSTVDVYGFPQSPVDEQATLNGGEYGYGRSKLKGETSLTRRASEEGIPLTIIRPCNIIGPRSQFQSKITRKAMIAATRVRAAPMPIRARRDRPRNGFRGGLGAGVTSSVDRIVAPVDPS